MGKVNKFSQTGPGRIFMAGTFACAALLMTGCGQKESPADKNTEKTEETEAQTLVTRETEYYTELYEAETETDFFGEVLLRSIWEVMPDETRLWAAAFHADEVEKVVYTTYMEEDPDSYEITDQTMIEELFEAIDQMQAGGAVAAPVRQGDVFVFEMKDGTAQEFVFSLTCIVVDGQAYETDYSEPLWELTGNIMFGEESV